MPESIYIATSPQYEGIVKIGRTDRPVQERMDELSNPALQNEKTVKR